MQASANITYAYVRMYIKNSLIKSCSTQAFMTLIINGHSQGLQIIQYIWNVNRHQDCLPNMLS